MRKILIGLFISLSLVSMTQGQGIKFENTELSWDDILLKAKTENKYIFVDCYATWCGPCKVMDQKVYPLRQVGDFFNNKFISVKIQMDKTDADDSLIKRWYRIAGNLQSNYTVVVFPTYLFFSPDGKIVHKATSYHESSEFISIANDAFDPKKQFYAILNNFQPGKMDTAEMKGIARAFRNSGTNLSGEIAGDYLIRIPKYELKKPDNLYLMTQFQSNKKVLDIAIGYINSLSKKEFAKINTLRLLDALSKQTVVQKIVEKYLSLLSQKSLSTKENIDLMLSYKKDSIVFNIAMKYLNGLKNKIYTKENLDFASNFVKKTDDKYFNLFYQNAEKVDLLIGRKGFAAMVVDRAILNTDVNPVIVSTKVGQEPDFAGIYASINKKYGFEFANRNILSAKYTFYGWKAKTFDTNWNEYLKYAIEKFERYGSDTSNFFMEGTLNNIAYYDIFFHSIDKDQLNIAIKWMEGIIRRTNYKDGNKIDTYANLLYKVGKLQEALKWESRAMELSPTNNEIRVNYEKMLEGKPTWIK